MRFLIVLALIKCALPIGHSMNVDIDVSVDVDAARAGSQDQCIPKGGDCLEWPGECCSPSTCQSNQPVGNGKICLDPLEQCIPEEGDCERAMFDCCPSLACIGTYNISNIEVAWKCSSKGQCSPEESLCFFKPGSCCPPLTCNGEKGHEWRCFDKKQCLPKGSDCWEEPGHCCPPLTCIDNPDIHPRPTDDDYPPLMICVDPNDVIPPSQGDCIKYGQKCKSSSDCCKFPPSLKCYDPTGLGRPKICLPGKKGCNANEGEECRSDDDCCENDNTCTPEGFCEQKKSNDCIADGEPCHGTDDWTHECCSKSCCEGKCGYCWGWARF